MLLAILVLRPKNAHIMLDSQNNATLVPENALFLFKQNVQTQASCVLIINWIQWKVLNCLFMKLLIQPKLVQWEEGVADADAILFEQARGLWVLTADQLGPDSVRVQLDSVQNSDALSWVSYTLQLQKSFSQTQKQIITMLLNSKIYN